jgi:hypothetical protein
LTFSPGISHAEAQRLEEKKKEKKILAQRRQGAKGAGGKREVDRVG